MPKVKVYRLTPAGPIIRPEREVIAELRDLTDRARHGEIKGIGFFLIDRADSVITGWKTGCASGTSMASGAAKLFHRVLAASLE